jgi:hypothetical protein
MLGFLPENARAEIGGRGLFGEFDGRQGRYATPRHQTIGPDVEVSAVHNPCLKGPYKTTENVHILNKGALPAPQAKEILHLDPLQPDDGDYKLDPPSSGALMIHTPQGRAAPEPDGFRVYAVKIQKDDDSKDVIVTGTSAENYRLMDKYWAFRMNGPFSWTLRSSSRAAGSGSPAQTGRRSGGSTCGTRAGGTLTLVMERGRKEPSRREAGGGIHRRHFNRPRSESSERRSVDTSLVK